MSPRLTALGSVVVSGLVAPGLPAGPETSHSELIRYLRERITDREPDGAHVHTVYVPDQRGEVNVLVGVVRRSVEDVPDGDVYAVLPPSPYALFTPDPLAIDPVEDVWHRADGAEIEGLLDRAVGPCFELTGRGRPVELWVPIILN